MSRRIVLLEGGTLADLAESAVRSALETRSTRGPLVVGLCGAQGSGKSTLAAELGRRIARTAVLSLDDIYLTRQERLKLASEVHPLLRTRGVPGTHDLDLGLRILDALTAGRPVPVPRFDKATDDRVPEAFWEVAQGDRQLIVFEGWCVGALPQPTEALSMPVNRLEREEDADGLWRRHVNQSLAAGYQRLFARIDLLVMLAAPGFEAVFAWRNQQEAGLRATRSASTTAIMSEVEIARFISHYERLTRHILTEMPNRADLTFRLAEDRSLLAVERAD